jgi:glycosyltransferase involved in cell wall biosynthesis
MAAEFSVIVPTFRRLSQLREAAMSVLAQRDVKVELFIVDDSPEASAREVVDSLNDSRVNYIVNPRPTGGVPSIVRNIGLSHAKGELVHFLDDDDIVPDGHYLTVRQALVDHPDVGIVFGRIEPFGDCSPEQLEHERLYFRNAARKAAACQRLGRRWGFASEMLFGRAMLVCSAAVVRRECALALKGFDPTIRLMEDADFNIRMMREFGAYFIDKTVLNYRIGSPSLMHNPNPNSAQLAEEREGRRKFRNKYRAERGTIEFYALALLCRTVLKLVP